MSEPTKAVLSKNEGVAPTQEAWAAELAWRAVYTGETALDHAIKELIANHAYVESLKAEIAKLKGEQP